MVADCWGNSIRMVTRDGLSLATVGGGAEGHQDGPIQVPMMSHVPSADMRLSRMSPPLPRRQGAARRLDTP